MSIIYDFNIPFSIRTFFLPGVPSSSTLIEPQWFGNVPSSIAVTFEDAICLPKQSENTELPFATDVASNECPQASWNITPPNPLSIAAIILPAGQLRAFNITYAERAASLP